MLLARVVSFMRSIRFGFNPQQMPSHLNSKLKQQSKSGCVSHICLLSLLLLSSACSASLVCSLSHNTFQYAISMLNDLFFFCCVGILSLSHTQSDFNRLKLRKLNREEITLFASDFMNSVSSRVLSTYANVWALNARLHSRIKLRYSK